MKSNSRVLLRAREIEDQATMHGHPWNPQSEICGTQLGRLAGLSRTGVSLVRVAPGKESFVYHAHELEEEWVYILSGAATAEIDGVEYNVGPGDFMGFAAPSVAHHLRNTGSDDLVYLMGGENREVEVATFPRLNRRMLRMGDRIEVFDVDAARPFGPEPGATEK